MVNLEARREMAGLMRKFARGAVTVDEFEAKAWELSELDSNALDCTVFAWCFYDDFRTQHLVGKWKLSKENRRIWATWILFLLTSDSSYEGPALSPSVLPFVICVVLYLIACIALAMTQPILALISYPVFYLFIYFDVVGSICSAVRPPKALPEHWPFPTNEDFRRAIALPNPFAAAA